MGEDRVRHQGCESDNTSQATPTRESDNRKARVRQPGTRESDNKERAMRGRGRWGAITFNNTCVPR